MIRNLFVLTDVQYITVVCAILNVYYRDIKNIY